MPPSFILKYKDFLNNMKKKICNKMIQMKMENYKKRLIAVEDLPVQIIPVITSFIEMCGIQSVTAYIDLLLFF